ncbi:MAG: RNA methyltransferase [Clostridiales bacterium]|nr:RNA methyltransferase [Clostridiales bacterium]
MEERITSTRNRQVVEAAKLLSPKGRREQGRFLLEGERLVGEALRAGLRLTALYARDPGQAEAKGLPLPVTPVSDEVLQRLCDTVTPQGVVAVAELPEDRPLALCPGGAYLLLENLQNAGNVGNVLRTAEAFDLDGVLFCGDRVDLFSPKVLRGSMGSSLRVQTAHYDTPQQLRQAADAAGLPLWGAALSDRAIPLTQASLAGGIVAVGNEGAGLSEALLALCDQLVVIPMAGMTESLSAATAAAILMWELWARRRPD